MNQLGKRKRGKEWERKKKERNSGILDLEIGREKSCQAVGKGEIERSPGNLFLEGEREKVIDWVEREGVEGKQGRDSTRCYGIGEKRKAFWLMKKKDLILYKAYWSISLYIYTDFYKIYLSTCILFLFLFTLCREGIVFYSSLCFFESYNQHAFF